ncbi:MAG: AEC family transporter, partial [Caulobacterales bacterium]|uniref:AEC family transporter n=1 Tax=Glycocaulis sp. TaxID=1969725 RepID=UPI003F9EC3C6
LRRWQVIPDGQWRGINLLNYRVLLPCVLFVTIARADLMQAGALPVLAVSAGGILLGLVLSLGVARLMKASARETAALVAVCCVWNVVLFFTLADRLQGEASLQWTGTIAAPSLVLATIIIVLAFAGSRDGGMRKALPALMRDPVLIACLLAVAVALIASILPPVLPAVLVETLLSPLDLAGYGSLALVLICMGAGLDFAALKGRIRLLFSAALIRSLAVPVAVLLAAGFIGVDAGAQTLLVLALGGPSAAFVYAVATEFDGETGLTAGMITLTVLASAIALPILTALTLLG